MEQRQAWCPRGAGTRSRSWPARPCWGGAAAHGFQPPARSRAPGPYIEDCPLEDRGGRCSRLATRSPDSGLDCGSEEEESRVGGRTRVLRTASPSLSGPRQPGPCPCRRCLRPLLARRRTLTRQNSVEGDFGEFVDARNGAWSDEPPPSPERPGKSSWERHPGQDCSEVWRRGTVPPGPAQLPPRAAGSPWVCPVTPSACHAPSPPRSAATPACWTQPMAPPFALGE